MTVGFVASATSGSQASVASFNIGTLGTGARCGIVFVATHNDSSDIITGVTWNGVAMTRIGRAVDTDTEPGSIVAYFLDNVTNGTITVSRTNNAVVTVGYAASISAAMACRVSQFITRVASTQNTDADTSTTGTGASGEVAVDDGSPGTSSMRFAAAYSGAATPPSNGTNSTALQVLDSTAFGSRFVRETTAGQGSRSVGFATGTTDDWALVAVAVSENNRNATVTATGGGVATPALTTARNRTETDTGGGVLTAAVTSARSSSQGATGAGAATTSVVAGRESAVIATGGGVLTYDYERSADVENHDAIVTATGGGVAVVVATTGRNVEVTATGAGAATLSAIVDRTSSPVVTGGGIASVALTTARSVSPQATGGGAATAQAEAGRTLAALLSGGGVLTLEQLTSRASSPTATGGGVATVDGTQATGHEESVTATGGGVLTIEATSARSVELLAVGGGALVLVQTSARLVTVAVTGSGEVTVGTEDEPQVFANISASISEVGGLGGAIVDTGAISGEVTAE